MQVPLDQGDEPVSACCSSREINKIAAAHLTACGGFQRVTLGHFEPSAKEYKRIAIHEQVELLSFMGEIARDDKGQSQLHVKVVVGKSDGTACGGHLFEASVRPAMEIVIVESPWELRRRVREDVGLALLDLKRW